MEQEGEEREPKVGWFVKEKVEEEEVRLSEEEKMRLEEQRKKIKAFEPVISVAQVSDEDENTSQSGGLMVLGLLLS